MEFVLSVLESAWNDSMQRTALVVLVVVFALAFPGIGKEQGFLARIASIAPNTLTSIGIFIYIFGDLDFPTKFRCRKYKCLDS